MGWFDGILKVAAPILGGVFGGPVGAAIGGSLGEFVSKNGKEIGSAVGSLIGENSAQSAAESAARQQNVFNVEAFNMQADYGREMAARQEAHQHLSASNAMEYGAKLANTTYQRGIADMQAAGLNPMLAYHQGGAPSPTTSPTSGASGGSVSAPPQIAPRMAAITTAATLAKVQAEIHKIEAEADVARSQRMVNMAQVPRIEQDTRHSISSAAHLDAQTTDLLERLRVLMPEQHARLASEVYRSNALYNLTQQQIQTELEKTKLTKAEAALAASEIARAKNIEATQGSWWMKNVSPYMTDVSRGASSAAMLRMLLRR